MCGFFNFKPENLNRVPEPAPTKGRKRRQGGRRKQAEASAGSRQEDGERRNRVQVRELAKRKTRSQKCSGLFNFKPEILNRVPEPAPIVRFNNLTFVGGGIR